MTNIQIFKNNEFGISTHTSRVGCDGQQQTLRQHVNNFYSHIPCGMWPNAAQNGIPVNNHFYSHIPCGMWPRFSSSLSISSTFLLTHPVWDVTWDRNCVKDDIVISTHTSRVGCDQQNCWVTCHCKISTHTSRVGCDSNFLRSYRAALDFYSHIPCGMWQ